uniref:Uncharacterized protein n=1 Tax=Solanum tuberosum TaxID=4113 RepID=M1DU87_SOLTU
MMAIGRGDGRIGESQTSPFDRQNVSPKGGKNEEDLRIRQGHYDAKKVKKVAKRKKREVAAYKRHWATHRVNLQLAKSFTKVTHGSSELDDYKGKKARQEHYREKKSRRAEKLKEFKADDCQDHSPICRVVLQVAKIYNVSSLGKIQLGNGNRPSVNC